MSTAVERKYALTKIAAGDYLFPGNDGHTLWRIASYTDGETNGADFPDRTFWGAWKYGDTITRASEDLDLLEWDRWSLESGSNPTRAAAINDALRMT